MPRFIKLTTRGDDFVWVNPEHIALLENCYIAGEWGYTRITVAHNFSQDVTETIDEILGLV